MSRAMERPATTRIRCPRCRAKDFTLTETCEVTLTWVVNEGALDRAEGYREYGGAYGVNGRCLHCDHFWKLRRAFQIDDAVQERQP